MPRLSPEARPCYPLLARSLPPPTNHQPTSIESLTPGRPVGVITRPRVSLGRHNHSQRPHLLSCYSNAWEEIRIRVKSDVIALRHELRPPVILVVVGVWVDDSEPAYILSCVLDYCMICCVDSCAAFCAFNCCDLSDEASKVRSACATSLSTDTIPQINHRNHLLLPSRPFSVTAPSFKESILHRSAASKSERKEDQKTTIACRLATTTIFRLDTSTTVACINARRKRR
jgi:hypothetical protein